jgi:hypothetical protein
MNFINIFDNMEDRELKQESDKWNTDFEFFARSYFEYE